MAKPKTIKVLVTVNTMGLYPGDQAMIEHLPIVDDLLKLGYLVELRPVKTVRSKRGKSLPE